MGTYGSVILLGSYEHRDACWGNAPRRFTEEILNSVTPRYSLVGHGFIQSRSCLHGGRQSGRVTSFFVASPLPHTSTTSCSKTENPGVTAPGLPLFTRKSQFQNSLGFEEENPKSMEDLRVFTRRPPTDCSICRRCDQSNRCIRFSIPPLGGGI